jgi:hypothetical protein
MKTTGKIPGFDLKKFKNIGVNLGRMIPSGEN